MPITVILDTFRALLREKLSAMPFWLRTLVVYAWPPAMVFSALYLTAANGRFIARRHRRSILRQFTGQIRLAFAEGIPPKFYYLYELHEPENARRACEYIHRTYVKNNGLYKLLYRNSPERKARAKLLNDKLAFHQFCREQALPTAEIYALVENGVISWLDENRQRLPERSLFIKLRRGKGGREAERWIYRDGLYSEPDGRSLNADQLTDHLIEASFDGPRLVQENLVNHPALSELTAGALSTLRMYTILDERGCPENVFTKIRMSQDPESVVDNIHRGGLGAAVDSATGKLERATDNGTLARTGWLERHPVTGAQILGHQVPFWRDAVDLALAAHSALDELFVAGWDIAVTEDGPRLIEGNKAPAIESDQKLSFPWGNERFGQLLAHHLAAMDDGGENRGTIRAGS